MTINNKKNISSSACWKSPANLKLALLLTSAIIRTVNCGKLKFRKLSLARKQKGSCTSAASRHFPRSIDVVAWPVQRKFSRCRKFQKSCNETGDLKCKLGVGY